MPVLGPVRGMILPWRQTLYVVAMSVLFLIGLHYMLSHRHNWWGWAALVVFAVADEIVFLIWRRAKAKT